MKLLASAIFPSRGLVSGQKKLEQPNGRQLPVLFAGSTPQNQHKKTQPGRWQSFVNWVSGFSVIKWASGLWKAFRGWFTPNNTKAKKPTKPKPPPKTPPHGPFHNSPLPEQVDLSRKSSTGSIRDRMGARTPSIPTLLNQLGSRPPSVLGRASSTSPRVDDGDGAHTLRPNIGGFRSPQPGDPEQAQRTRVTMDVPFRQSGSNSAKVANDILKAAPGNAHLYDTLQRCIYKFKVSLQDEAAAGPALRLYLPGAAQGSKEKILTKLQTELNDDVNGLIRIDMRTIESGQDLQGKLQAATQPDGKLAGKTLWLDQFQDLDNPNRTDERKKSLQAFLKALFSLEQQSLGQAHELVETYGIDPQNTIVAISTTGVNLEHMATMQPITGVGNDSLYSRINASTFTLNAKPAPVPV